MKTVLRQCENCNSEFLADPREVNRGNAKFCSQSCSSSRPRTEPNRANTECAWCQKPLYRKPTQMSKSKSGLFFCSIDHQNLAYASDTIAVSTGPKNSSGVKWNKPIFNCVWHLGCEARTSEYYCHHHARVDQMITLWLSGDNSVTHGGKNQEPHAWVKKHIVYLRGDACEVCGFNELHPFYHTSIIQMDHIDGNSLNNDPSNLKLLCPNHHTMTITYGSRNKNSGRHSRRMASIKASMIDS